MKRFFQTILFSICIINSSAVIKYDSIKTNIGMRVATLRYAEVGLPTSGWLPVFSGGKLGFTDLNGEEKLPPTYEKSELLLVIME